MTPPQIQLPDEVYERVRKLCAAREIAFAELSRRGLEYILSAYTAEPGTREWQPPKPRWLGWKGLTDAQLKEQAQTTAVEAAGNEAPCSRLPPTCCSTRSTRNTPSHGYPKVSNV